MGAASQPAHPQGHGNPIVKAGNGVFFMMPRCGRHNREHTVRNTTIETQTVRCLEKMGEFLAESGSSFNQITYILVRLAKPEYLEPMDRAYRDYFKGALPLRTVMVGNLPQPDMMVVMGCVACAPAS